MRQRGVAAGLRMAGGRIGFAASLVSIRVHVGWETTTPELGVGMRAHHPRQQHDHPHGYALSSTGCVQSWAVNSNLGSILLNVLFGLLLCDFKIAPTLCPVLYTAIQWHMHLGASGAEILGARWLLSMAEAE